MSIINLTYGQKWAKVGKGFEASVQTHEVFNSELYVGVNYRSNDEGQVHKLNSNGNWQQIGSGLDGKVRQLLSFQNELYAISTLYIDGYYNSTLYKLNNNTWKKQVAKPGNANQLFIYDNTLHVTINDITKSVFNADSALIYTWDGSGLKEFAFAEGEIYECVDVDGDLIIAGDFVAINGKSLEKMAMFDGSNWNDLKRNFDIWCSRLSWDLQFQYFKNILYYSDDCISEVDGVEITSSPLIEFNGNQWDESNLSGKRANYLIHGSTNTLFATEKVSKGKDLFATDGKNGWTKINVNSGVVDTMFLTEIFVFENELYGIGDIYNSSFTQIGVIKLSLGNAIVERQPAQNFTVFPNPVNSQIILNAQFNDCKYSIYNSYGSSVSMGVLNGNTIPVSDLSEGFYTITIENEKGEFNFSHFLKL